MKDANNKKDSFNNINMEDRKEAVEEAMEKHVHPIKRIMETIRKGQATSSESEESACGKCGATALRRLGYETPDIPIDPTTGTYKPIIFKDLANYIPEAVDIHYTDVGTSFSGKFVKKLLQKALDNGDSLIAQIPGHAIAIRYGDGKLTWADEPVKTAEGRKIYKHVIRNLNIYEEPWWKEQYQERKIKQFIYIHEGT